MPSRLLFELFDCAELLVNLVSGSRIHVLEFLTVMDSIVADSRSFCPFQPVDMHRPYGEAAGPERYGQMILVVSWASMNSATDTIISTGPGEVAMIDLAYRINARVAPEALLAWCVMFSKNFLYSGSLGNLLLKY